MEYGLNTKQFLGLLNSGEVLQKAGGWTPDAFTLPFPERLAAMVSEYYDLPSEPFHQKTALYDLIRAGADQHGTSFSRTTLNQWLNGKRDPSVSSSDQTTRENIYRLSAALDFDLELTVELFEKVFFSRAFFPKDLQELTWFYFARRDYVQNISGAAWYQEGLQMLNRLQTSPETVQEAPITETTLLLSQAELLSELEFLHFLQRHRSTFSKENRNKSAREKIRSYAQLCSNICGFKTAVDCSEIPWEPLISRITGYNQRSKDSAAGPVAKLRALPSQLTTNFPTGMILKDICSGSENSFDRLYKMICLLIFYAFFSSSEGFDEYLRFTNLELDSMGFPELYPGQPYCGLLLFCAAQENPIQAFQHFIAEAVSAESDLRLSEKLRASFPGIDTATLRRLLAGCGRVPFTVDLLCNSSALMEKKTDLANLLSDVSEEDTPDLASEQMLQALLYSLDFSAEQCSVLRCCSLLPPSGISDVLFDALFGEQQKHIAYRLSSAGWLIHENGQWKQDYRIRSLIYDQEWFPRGENCAEFVRQFLALFSEREVTPFDPEELRSLSRKLLALDGIRPELQAELKSREGLLKA